MVTICDGCGKKYSINPEKIKGDSAWFKCNSCGQIITVHKSLEVPQVEKIEKKSVKEKLDIEGLSI
ncbi:MAG: hypothetical protein HKO91_05290, partial [Desulfobacterales bacterium]|nr:hypothetical protein [Desulfobacterales bacterium]